MPARAQVAARNGIAPLLGRGWMGLPLVGDSGGVWVKGNNKRTRPPGALFFSHHPSVVYIWTLGSRLSFL